MGEPMLTDAEIMAEVLAAFQEEQAEHCQSIGDTLLDLEREPHNPQRTALLEQLFRDAHSLKGGARAAGQMAVEQLAHRMEDLFSAVRQGKLILTAEVCDPIYTTLDAIGELMSQVAAGQEADLKPYQPLLDTLSRHVGEGGGQASSPAKESLPLAIDPSEHPPQPPSEPLPPPAPQLPPQGVQVASEAPASSELVEPEPPVLPASPSAELLAPLPPAEGERKGGLAGGTRKAGEPEENQPWEVTSTTVRLATSTLDRLMNETGELITCSVRAQQRAREARELAEHPTRWRRIWRQNRSAFNRLQEFIPSFQPTVHHLSDREVSVKAKPSKFLSSVTYQDINQLLEVVLQANDIINDLEQRLAVHTRQISEDYTRLSTVTDRLHDQIRRTRMLPLTTLFNPLPLQIREMARLAGKQVVLDLDDGGAEADRQVLERLREVLLHLLRNAVDHGIEMPEVRSRRGKQPLGRISLQASVSGDHLLLTLGDDGGGLEVETIRQRALTQGYLNEADSTRASDVELVDLIFVSGFSTRQTVSKLSGRGVGLDVVRSQVERMQGRVAVQSTPGHGCSFTISVPLSLTSSHGLLLHVGSATYMLPLDAVQRIVPILPGQIQKIENRAAILLDNRPIALVHLADLLARDDHRPANLNKPSPNRAIALILGSGERQVACMVDGVIGEQELVIYRLPPPLQRVRFIAGATILADGEVVPILDLVDLLRAAIGSHRIISLTTNPVVVNQRRPLILVVDDSVTTRTLEKNILEAAGYQVQMATDGQEALQVLRRLPEDNPCHLLLSDVDMPRLNGFELTSQVRADSKLKHLPIVLVTSLDTPADRERGISAGADAYIVKRAFDQQTLLETIAQLI